MAKRPPKRYHPGELDKTRSRLGPLSREEAEEMSRRLGGEVGVEKDRPEIEDSYRKLRDRFYEGKMVRRSRISGASGRQGGGERFGSSARIRLEIPERSYSQRWKLWFFASRPEFGIMKRSRAWLALWPFAKPSELIHPAFIMGSGDIFYRHVETFVLALRGILRKVDKNRVHQLRNSLYRQIAETIKDWEIEAMHRELARLQTHPRSTESREIASVLFYLYRPLIILSRLDPKNIQRAMRHLFDLSILELPKRNLEADRLRRYYIAASEELDYLFRTLPLRCYPLLLLLFSPEVSSYRELIEGESEGLLHFFRLQPEDIIEAPKIPDPEDGAADAEAAEAEEPEKADDGEPGGEGEEEQGSGSEDPAEKAYPTISYRRSLFMLERLFPGSGWISLEDRPDLYPYFEPVLKLPQGSGMVPPGDPLQYVIILTSIIAELFYGFRGADPGVIIDGEGNPLNAKEAFDTIGSKWHQFLDELLEKQYLGTLRDYCRNIERSYDFVLSEYGRRMEADLLFLRQRFFFPGLQLSIPKYLQPRKLPSLPKYYRTVEELKEVLQWMNEGEGWSTGNRGIHYAFPVENSLSRRLSSLLDFEGKSKTLEELARYALAAVMVLDHILKQEGDAPSPLYRHVDQREDLPVYAVTSLNTGQLLQRVEQKRKEGIFDPSEITGDYDHATGLGGFELARKELVKITDQNLPSLALLRLRSDAREGRQILADARKMEAGLRLFQDQLFRIRGAEFLIILPGYGEEEAIRRGWSILSSLRSGERRGPVASIIIHSSSAEEEEERNLLRESENSLPVGMMPESPALYLWDRDAQEAKPLSS